MTTELIREAAGSDVAIVNFNVTAGGGVATGCNVHAALFQNPGGPAVASAQVPAAARSQLQLRILAPKLWSPADPFLYNATVRLVGGCGDAGAEVNDTLNTYVGIRSVRLQPMRVHSAPSCAHRSVKDGPMESVTTTAHHTVCQRKCEAPQCAGWTWSSHNGSCVLHALLQPPIEHAPRSWCGSWATKLLLNGKPIFMAGVLSQGFWPDGGYTVPTDEADVHELVSLQQMGFNMVRKHLLVAPHRWYYHADRLGMLVFQDMPERIHHSGGRNFAQELDAMVRGRRNHPSIIQWSILNEVDPYPTSVELLTSIHVRKHYRRLRSLDPTRPINSVSGSLMKRRSTQRAYWSETDIQDHHAPTFNEIGPINASLLVTVSEAHRSACLPPKEHTWFHALKSQGGHACYGAKDDTRNTEMTDDCEAAAASYAHWASNELHAIRYFGLSMVGYVQNRDMEGECNGVLTFDGEPKLNATKIHMGNALLYAAHDELWNAEAAVSPVAVYLAKHGEMLEALIATAMAAISRTLPDDPVDALIKALEAGRATPSRSAMPT